MVVVKKVKIVLILDVVKVIINVFLIKISFRNDCCLIVREGLNWVCLYFDCLKNRVVFVFVERVEMFVCKYVNFVKSGLILKFLDIWILIDFDIGNYEVGEIV